MRNVRPWVAAAALVVSAIWAGGAIYAADAFKRLSIDEVASMVGKARIIDVNPSDMYAKYHLPAAQWAVYDGVTAEVLPADKAAAVIFYCANEQCTASHTAARQALALGWSNVAIMPAGIFGWIEAKQPVEKARPAS